MELLAVFSTYLSVSLPALGCLCDRYIGSTDNRPFEILLQLKLNPQMSIIVFYTDGYKETVSLIHVVKTKQNKKQE